MTGSTETLYAEFGALVVAHRQRLEGMKQAELGRRIGLSRTSVTNIEQGRHHVSLQQFLRIASALEVAPEALLSEAGCVGRRSQWRSSPDRWVQRCGTRRSRVNWPGC